MGLTGKYDFKGIKDKGAKGILLALSLIPQVGAFFLKFPFIRNMAEGVLELLVNWLANKGLVILNVGMNFVNGEIDQKTFDKAFEEGLRKIEVVGRDRLTPEQGKAIDDAVRKAADKFIPFNRE